jgi:hypothetical protein
MTWEPGYDPTREARVAEIANKVFAVMFALPARRDNPRSAEDLQRWSQSIANTEPWSMPFKNGMKRAKRSVIDKEIKSFARAIRKAERILLDFHNPTFGKALDIGSNVWSIRESMQPAIEFAAKLADISLQDISTEQIKGSGLQRSQVIAQMCANYYYRITGHNPKRDNWSGNNTSAFVIFIQDIFRATNITASADEAARQLASTFDQLQKNAAAVGGLVGKFD